MVQIPILSNCRQNLHQEGTDTMSLENSVKVGLATRLILTLPTPIAQKFTNLRVKFTSPNIMELDNSSKNPCRGCVDKKNPDVLRFFIEKDNILGHVPKPFKATLAKKLLVDPENSGGKKIILTLPENREPPIVRGGYKHNKKNPTPPQNSPVNLTIREAVAFLNQRKVESEEEMVFSVKEDGLLQVMVSYE